jgi:hypothetical protein
MIGATGLAGCRNLGYNDQSANNALTPGIQEQQYTRTWQPAPSGTTATPTVVQTTPTAATTDPSYPNYKAPPSPAPAPAVAGKTPTTTPASAAPAAPASNYQN